MLTWQELEQRRQQQALALKAAEAATPLHSACEAGIGSRQAEDGEAGEAEEALRRRDLIQHRAEPYPPEAPEVARADLGKYFTQAYDAPAGYPAPAGPVSPEAFRRGPVTAGEAAYSPGSAPSARTVPVPSAALSAAAISRPLLTDGRAQATAPAGRPGC